MKLLAYSENSELELREVAVPTPEKGQVLVKVEAAPLHSSDLANSIPGTEGSGVVVQSGGGVTAWRLIGKKVSFLHLESTQRGSWAEYTVVPSKNVNPVGNDVSLQEASGMMLGPLQVMMMQEHINQGEGAMVTWGHAGALLARWCEAHRIPFLIVSKEPMPSCLQVSDPEFSSKLKQYCRELNIKACFTEYGGSLAGKLLSGMPEGSTLYFLKTVSEELSGVSPTEFIFKSKKILGLDFKSWFSNLPMVKRYTYLKTIRENPEMFAFHMQGTFSLENYEEALKALSEESTSQVIFSTSEPFDESMLSAGVEENEDTKEEEEFDQEFIEKTLKEYQNSTVQATLARVPEFEWDYQLQDGVEVETRQMKLLGDMSVYRGEWSGDTLHGKGTRFFPDGSVYEGFFKEGLSHGKGRMVYPSGECYEGFWSQGERHGEGKLYLSESKTIEGHFENDQLTRGVENCEGTQYNGPFQNGLKQGSGMLVFSDGKVYTGEFHKDEIQGKGELTFPEGKKFVGVFENLSAEGEMLYNDGSKFKGKLIDAEEYGKGELVTSEGEILKGVWEKGEFKEYSQED